jgi:hypothetical protein
VGDWLADCGNQAGAARINNIKERDRRQSFMWSLHATTRQQELQLQFFEIIGTVGVWRTGHGGEPAGAGKRKRLNNEVLCEKSGRGLHVN